MLAPLVEIARNGIVYGHRANRELWVGTSALASLRWDHTESHCNRYRCRISFDIKSRVPGKPNRINGGRFMSTPSALSSQPGNDVSFLSALMPNRARTRFLRGIVLLFLVFGALGCLSVAASVFSEFYARHSWPVAQGQVSGMDVKSNKGRPGNNARHTSYWVEYEVRFDVPAGQCLTGTISADDQDPLSCSGTVRTRSTESAATANAWLLHHRLNSDVGILHDPHGPNVKIVGESLWLVYPWKGILITSGWMAFFLTFLNITQRRLRYLQTLPEDYDASPPSSQPPGPADLIDLKLS